MASVLGSEAASDGPVLSLMAKRLRNLRKKLNRIHQMEESLAQGKVLIKEQEDVLKSKPAVLALIDEYEKLRQPLSTALQEELSRLSPPPPKPSAEENQHSGDAPLSDLLPLLYFGCLFDVKPQSEFASTMYTRNLERSCCLTYDYVTDDATELLGERDLDMISALGGLVTSRPVCSGESHRNALQECIQHAKLWIGGAEQPIYPGAGVTYAGLKEKLNKIMASDYFTATPQMKAPVDVAAAVGNYNSACQPQVSEGSDTVAAPQVEEHKEEEEDLQSTDGSPDQSFPVVDLPNTDEPEEQNHSGENTNTQQEQESLEADSEHSQRDAEHKEQYISRRPYQNQRDGTRAGGGGGGRRPYVNGRGGRGGRGVRGGGGYQNGRSQQYYDSGYYPRNYHNTRGRGGRSGGSGMYNNHSAATAAHGGHAEVGTAT